MGRQLPLSTLTGAPAVSITVLSREVRGGCVRRQRFPEEHGARQAGALSQRACFPLQGCPLPTHRSWALSLQSSMFGLLVRSSSLVWATFRKADLSLMAFRMDSMVISVWKISCSVCRERSECPMLSCVSLLPALPPACPWRVAHLPPGMGRWVP